MESVIVSNNEFVVLDIETSHFSPKKGAMIIELAAVKIKDGKIVDKRTQLIDPKRKLTKKIIEITGITDEMLKGKPTFNQVLPRFYDFLGNAVVVGHNVRFDWDRFLVYFLNKVGIYPNNLTVDTLALAKKYLNTKQGENNLGSLCELCGIRLSNAHRALNDALATAELFLHLKNNFITHSTKLNQKQMQIPEIRPKNQNIRKASYWEKKNNKRLYVTLDRSVVFYDIPSRAWEVKSSNEPIDFKDVEKKTLKHLNLQSVDDLIKKYA